MNFKKIFFLLALIISINSIINAKNKLDEIDGIPLNKLISYLPQTNDTTDTTNFDLLPDLTESPKTTEEENTILQEEEEGVTNENMDDSATLFNNLSTQEIKELNDLSVNIGEPLKPEEKKVLFENLTDFMIQKDPTGIKKISKNRVAQKKVLKENLVKTTKNSPPTTTNSNSASENSNSNLSKNTNLMPATNTPKYSNNLKPPISNPPPTNPKVVVSSPTVPPKSPSLPSIANNTKKTLHQRTEFINFKKEFITPYFSVKYVREIIDNLSSSLFQGRETGTRGQRLSLSFLNYELEKMHYVGPYEGSFIQLVKLEKQYIQSTTLQSNNTTFRYGKDYHLSLQNKNPISNGSYNLIFIGLPSENAIIQNCKLYYKTGVKNALLFTPNNNFDLLSLYKTVNNLKPNYNIDLICILNNNEFEVQRQKVNFNLTQDNKYTYALSSQWYNKYFINTLFVTSTFLKQSYNNKLSIYKLNNYIYYNEKYPFLNYIKPINIEVKTNFTIHEMGVGNIIAVSTTFDPNKENIIVTANYDGIANSENANYNASGVASILSLARIFSHVYKQHELNKNIVFILFVGKNQGNLGAKFYTRFPLFPHNKTFMVVNLNGIGIIGGSKKSNFLYSSCADKYPVQFKKIIQNISSASSGSGHIKLDFSLNKNNSHIYNSDLHPFEILNIPAVEFSDMNISEEQKRFFSSRKNINYNALPMRIKYLAEFIWNTATTKITSKDILSKDILYNIIEQRK